MEEGVVARAITAYDPRADAAFKWAGWRFVPTMLMGVTRELISVRMQIVLLDQTWFEQDMDAAVAHAVAHLDLGHHRGGVFTPDQESAADWLARLRLDREGLR
jgi:hypothetical protein